MKVAVTVLGTPSVTDSVKLVRGNVKAVSVKPDIEPLVLSKMIPGMVVVISGVSVYAYVPNPPLAVPSAVPLVSTLAVIVRGSLVMANVSAGNVLFVMARLKLPLADWGVPGV